MIAAQQTLPVVRDRVASIETLKRIDFVRNDAYVDFRGYRQVVSDLCAVLYVVGRWNYTHFQVFNDALVYQVNRLCETSYTNRQLRGALSTLATNTLIEVTVPLAGILIFEPFM